MLRISQLRALLPLKSMPSEGKLANSLCSRLARRTLSSTSHLNGEKDPLCQEYDAIIVGAGHNGLITVSVGPYTLFEL